MHFMWILHISFGFLPTLMMHGFQDTWCFPEANNRITGGFTVLHFHSNMGSNHITAAIFKVVKITD